jgi:hypothetical protein
MEGVVVGPPSLFPLLEVLIISRLTLRVTKARMGDRSKVPPMGGMMPRKRLRYGSQIVL